jgi:DnaA family protein
MRQLILDLVPAQPPTLENFAAGSNAEALTGLAGWLAAESPDTCLLLWGESGAGKSHLLAASGAIYANAEDDPTLAGLPEEAAFVAVDNVEALDADGQIALFNRFNRLRAAGGRLLAGARVPPLQLALREDLRTRLGSGQIHRLRPLSDDEKRTALAAQARERGMSLAPEALDYLLARAPRDMRSLAAILAALDRYSLEQKRPLTLPLLRSVLQTHESQTA